MPIETYLKWKATLCVVPSARPRTNTRQVFFQAALTFQSKMYWSFDASYLKPLAPTVAAGSLASVGGVVPHGYDPDVG